MKIFSKETLLEYNGRNGKPAYIAYNGLVYDVSSSYHWREGNHWVVHDAGVDLTQEMVDAPHFDDVMNKFEVVGRYQ